MKKDFVEITFKGKELANTKTDFFASHREFEDTVMKETDFEAGGISP
jgi:hypothetical protein